MKLKVVKQTDEYTVFEKRSGRLAVKGADKKWVLGDDKIAILEKEGLRAKPEPKPAEPEAEAEAEATEGEAAE